MNDMRKVAFIAAAVLGSITGALVLAPGDEPAPAAADFVGDGGSEPPFLCPDGIRTWNPENCGG